MSEQGDNHTSLNIVIHGQQYPITANGDEEYVRKVAAYVDDRMSMLKNKAPANTLIRLAVLAALNITDELFALRNENKSLMKELAEKTERMSHSLDKALIEK